MRVCEYGAFVTLLFPVLCFAMEDIIFSHHTEPTICSQGCALWSNLAGDNNTAPQDTVDAKWHSHITQNTAARSCSMPGSDPRTTDSWCYCKGTGSDLWGLCSPPSLFPSQQAVYAVSATEVVVVFVTQVPPNNTRIPLQPRQAKRRGATARDLPLPQIHIAPMPAKIETWVSQPSAGTATDRVFNFIYLGGLQFRTNYTYTVRSGSATGDDDWSDLAYFVTFPKPGEPTSFTIWGDMGVYSYNNMDSVVKYFEEGRVDFAAHIGDHGYNIGVESRGDGYFDGNSVMYTKGIWVPGIGNHEFYDGDEFNRFDTYTSGIGKYHPTSKTSKYYSLDIGMLHMVVLDSTSYFGQPGAPTQAQRAWLEEDLKNVNRSITPWVLVTAHHPMYCSSITVFDDTLEKQVFGEGYNTTSGFLNCIGSGVVNVEIMRVDLEPLLLKYGVDVYMCGHEHNYESIFPVKEGNMVQSNFTEPRAPVHIVSGAGGGPELDQFGEKGPWTRLQINEAWSHSVVDVVNSTTLIWRQYFNSYYKDGALADEIVITQHNHGPFV